MAGCVESSRPGSRSLTWHPQGHRLFRLRGRAPAIGDRGGVRSQPHLNDRAILGLISEWIARISGRAMCSHATACLTEYVPTGVILKHQATSRLSSSDLIARLASTDVFGTLDESALREVETELEWLRLPGGSTLFKEGDPGDGLYIVLSGRLRIAVEAQGGEPDLIGEVGRGEIVGEMAMLIGEERMSTVHAVRDTELVKFSNEACLRVAEKHPRLLLRIAKVIAKRLAARNQASRAGTSLSNIAVVPLDSTLQLSAFAKRLAAALSAVGSTLYLNSQRLDDLWGKPGTAQTPGESEHSLKVESWLNHQEGLYRFLLYEADASASHWTQRCLRQADRILLVGSSDTSSGSGETVRLPAVLDSEKAAARTDLVLVHSQDLAVATDTQTWIDTLHVTQHYHVRWSRDQDFSRLARLLTGHAVGLVLGGGGARGFAHIGAILAFEESGIPIDFIGGTSMGSLIAAQYAQGWDYEKMISVNRTLFKDSWPMNDYTLPLMACLSGQKFDRTLRTMYADTRVEDLILNYFCVSTNLTRAVMAVHQHGLLWRRVRASCSLPGIMPPEYDNGDILVDGAVLNNLPGDVMKRLCGGRVAAVDVSPREDIVFRARTDRRPTTRSVVWSRVNPFAEAMAVPGLFDIVSRSAMINSISNLSALKGQVDLYLHIPLEQFGMTDSHAFEKIVQIGYEAAKHQIASQIGPQMRSWMPTQGSKAKRG